MTNIIQKIEKTRPEITNPVSEPVNDPVNELITHLLTDKKSVYFEDISINADGSFEVAYCREYTRRMAAPNWIDTAIARDTLLQFIRDKELNYWESFPYDHHTGSIQPFNNVISDIDTF